MKFPLPRPLFPDAAVDAVDGESMQSLADALLDKLLLEERDFRIERSGDVDEAKWKFVRRNENISIYRERQPRAPRRPALSDPEEYVPNTTASKLLPPFLAVGNVPGSLDDMLYGFTAPTRESMLIKSSYVDDGVADIEVLRTIRGPTVEDPFSHLTLKWMVVAHSALVSPRDYVYVDTIGTRELPDGKRIGYRVSHSIDVRGVGPMRRHGFVRANMSICAVFRPLGDGHVQVYGRVFFEHGGALPRSLFSLVVASQIESAAAQMLNSQLKKLALALRRTDARTWTVAVPAPGDADMTKECGTCAKRLNLLNTSRAKCALCSRRLCVSCRVRKLLSFVEEDFSVTRLRVTFCVFCVQQAITLPSSFAATEEFLSGQEDFYRAPGSFSDAAVSSVDFRSFLSV